MDLTIRGSRAAVAFVTSHERTGALGIAEEHFDCTRPIRQLDHAGSDGNNRC